MIGNKKYYIETSDMLFLKSILDCDGKFMNTEKVLDWIQAKNNDAQVKVTVSEFSKLKNWKHTHEGIYHDSGKYFSIVGLMAKTNWAEPFEWYQPIINQPEVGYLGFITQEIEGVLHFLVQAKIEPGNINHVQISPTLQATRSNYTRVHRGFEPPYLSYFQNAKSSQIILDQLQSEQGARFLKKRNRNIIIKVDEDIEIRDNFTWLSLGQIKKLMTFDNLVNMDTRTVIAGITYGNYSTDILDMFLFSLHGFGNTPFKKALVCSAMGKMDGFNTLDQIITFLTHLKSEYDLEVQKTPLNTLSSWIIRDDGIFHEEGKYFRVIPVNVEISSREVVSWSQPMIEPAQDGLCAFVCKQIDGLLHFAVQAKLECGNHDIIEFAPTVQCLTGNYRETEESALPFLEYVLSAKPEQVLYDVLQSEEGGRFYKEQNRNMIVLAGDEVSIDLPERYIWMTLNQMYTFIKFNNYLNIQARSLIAAISFI